MADMENGSQEPREPTPEEQVQLQGVTIQSLKNQLGNKCEEVANRDVQIAILQGQLQQAQATPVEPEPEDNEPALKAITQH